MECLGFGEKALRLFGLGSEWNTLVISDILENSLGVVEIQSWTRLLISCFKSIAKSSENVRISLATNLPKMLAISSYSGVVPRRFLLPPTSPSSIRVP